MRNSGLIVRLVLLAGIAFPCCSKPDKTIPALFFAGFQLISTIGVNLLMFVPGARPSKIEAWFGANAECPFVVQRDKLFYLFRNQFYGPGGLNTQYASDNPLLFGVDDDSLIISKMNISAPEIIEFEGQFYIAALNPNLDGIRIAKLKWE
jgi:hypothetical protein